MKSNAKKIAVICLSTMIVAESAFAARIGGKRSSGMKRNISQQRYAQPASQNQMNSQRPTPNAQQASPQQPANGRSNLGGIATGAAVGAVGGYMLGKAMNNNTESAAATSPEVLQNQAANPVQEQPATAAPSLQSNIPWGPIAIMGMLLFIGLMFFRRKTASQSSNATNIGKTPANSFQIPNIQRENANSQANSKTKPTFGQIAAPVISQKMADGNEEHYFLRQVKGIFLHIQSMNTAENVQELEKYMTPELYNDIRQMVAENKYVADFSQLDCQLLESTVENGNYVASVKFSGKISEEPGAAAIDFNEIWHFTKATNAANPRWIVAGIEQPSVN